MIETKQGTQSRTEIVLAEGNSTWVEDLLKQRGITYEREIAPLSAFDMDLSLHNQARHLALHEETVAVYEAAMANGDMFPAVVARRLHGRYVIADGNHRVRAAQNAGFTHIHCLVVKEAADRQVELFTYEANTKHGLPTSLEERIHQGLYLVEVGNTPKVVASALNIPEQRFYKEVSLARFEARAADAGIDVSSFSSNQKLRLAAIANDNVVSALTDLAVESVIGSTDLSELVTKVRAQRTESDALALIAKARAERLPEIRSTAAGKLPLPKNVNRLRIACRMSSSIEIDKLANQVANLDPELRNQIRSEAVRAISVLAEAVDVVKKSG
jgi:ParB-like nuclease domain